MGVLIDIVVWLNDAANALGLTHVVVWLNDAANALGHTLAFIGFLPGWLSATLIAIVSGMAMLIAFKYTSNQRAIKRVRRDVRANLLAVKLFHDSLLVGFRALGRVLVAALRLLLLAIVPILAMLVPMTLLLGQLALWYQARPLRLGEEAVIILKLRGDTDAPWPAATLETSDAITDTHGPVRVYNEREDSCFFYRVVRYFTHVPVPVYSEREICWNVRAQKDGHCRLVFQIGSETVDKELAIGDTLMRVSTRRPDWDWSDALLHPREAPFGPDSAVQSIEVQYPTRSSWTSGADWWVGYWFAVSLLTGFCCKGLFKVNL